MVHDGLWCAFDGVHMIVHGSHVAAEYEVSREQQDRWALRSHQRAIAAIDSGKMAEEIVPVKVKGRKGESCVDTDEAPRRDTTLEKLEGLKPVFVKDGTVTAGNAPGVNDGACALVISSSDKAEELGTRPSLASSGMRQWGWKPAIFLSLRPMPFRNS